VLNRGDELDVNRPLVPGSAGVSPANWQQNREW
jgi:hypothetical protein